MLVLGINIALWFEGQFQAYQEAKAEEAYLVGLKRDLLEDASSLERLADVNEARTGRLAGILGAVGTLGDIPDEEAIGMMFEVSTYDFFEPEDFTYRAMQESGDFSLLSDADIKEALLRLHRRYKLIGNLEDNFLQALDDEYIPLMVRSIDMAAGRLADRAFGENLVARNMIAYAINDTQARTGHYRQAHDKALELVGLIDGQLSD
jgi:hypothetical protein